MKLFLNLLGFFILSLQASIISLEPVVDKPVGTLVVNDTLYVSNKASLNKGFINSYSLDGKLIKKAFVSGLASPAGMAFKNGILYVGDLNTIKGFNEKGEKVYEFSLTRASRLSDLVFNGEILMASDADNGTIFEIEIKSKKYRNFAILDSNMGRPAAMLIYDGKLLLANTSKKMKASLGYFNLFGDRNFISLGNMKGDFSGIVLDDNGYLLVSSRSNNSKIIEINFKAKLLKTLALSDLQGPCQLSFANGKLFVPLEGSSKLLMYKTHN